MSSKCNGTGAHDFESAIIGYHDPVPSGNGWLPIGYSKPIQRYTCKVCGYSFSDGGVTGFGLYQLLNPEPCPGPKGTK